MLIGRNHLRLNLSVDTNATHNPKTKKVEERYPPYVWILCGEWGSFLPKLRVLLGYVLNHSWLGIGDPIYPCLVKLECTFTVEQKERESQAFSECMDGKYALRITARWSKTTEVVSVVCQLCETYGTEGEPIKSRNAHCMFASSRNHGEAIIWSVTVRHSTKASLSSMEALTTDAARSHFSDQAWNRFIKMIGTGSRFTNKKGRVNCVHHWTLNYWWYCGTITIWAFIGGWGEWSQFEVKAMSMFHLNETDSDCPYYSIEIANSILFQLIVLHVGCGTSFWQCV